jgi:myo-inositol 2-dehydrogenase/D-chiro-inositol 1-dehydrogenase
VLIVDPHSLHEEAALLAARAGEHISCEKPLAANTAECYRMIDEAEQYGVKMVCGQVTRPYPVCHHAAQMARSGMLAEPAAVNVADLHHRDHVNWWARSETMGALLHSPGVHAIDYLLFV